MNHLLPDWLMARLRPADQRLARLLGFSGESTLSAECGRQAPQGRTCCLVCWVMSFIEKDHCARAARAEGLAKP